MKKSNLIWLSIIGLILLGALIVGIFYATGVLNSAINIQELSCSKTTNNRWDCSNYKGRFTEGAENKINFRISKPSAVAEWRSLKFETAKDINSDLKSFVSSHTVASTSQTSCKIGNYKPYDSENDWNSKIGVQEYNLGYGEMSWCLSDEIIYNIIGTQFVVIEGRFNDQCPSGGSANHSTEVRTYGLCNDRNCWVYDLFPDRAFQKWSNAGASDTCGLLEVQSIKIYSKDGGYTEEEGKNQFGFNIIDEDIEVFRLENNECINYVIKESTKLSSDYSNLESCESDILTEEEIQDTAPETNQETVPSTNQETIPETENNLPSNESNIKTSFWNTKTLGMKNLYWIISLISLIAIFIIVFIVLIRRK